MSNPRFSYIRSRRPVVGQLVRNTGFGSRISEVVAVEGPWVWLRGIYFTHKGTLRKLRGTMVKHRWDYQKLMTQRYYTPEDNATHDKLIAAWDHKTQPWPSIVATGPKYITGGYWRTGWHRPVRRNY